MNALAPLSGSAVPAAFQSFKGPDMASAAQAGLQASFAVIGFRGKNWRLKYRGDEILVKDARGLPEQQLEVVIVGVSPNISKLWYAKKYTEGDDAAPDCFSINGEHPDPASPKKQCESCAVCPQNAWGSRMTEAGKKAKACQDSRRIAVVPLADIENADFGGAMMLRLPPTSLAGFAAFSRELARFGGQPFMVATQLAFDSEMAYPLITFKAARWLVEDEAQRVMEAIADPQIDRMLTTELEVATHDPASAPESSPLAAGGPSAAFKEPPPAAAAEPVSPPPPPPTPPAPAAAAQPEPSPLTPAAPAAATRKASPFGAPSIPINPPEKVAAPAAEAAAPAETVRQVVQQAPSDMEKAIDDLLNG